MTKYKLEYIWLDGYTPTPNLRGKTQIKTYDSFPTLEELPLWGFDGSSTMQAEGHSSDCVLKPVRVFPDAARANRSIFYQRDGSARNAADVYAGLVAKHDRAPPPLEPQAGVVQVVNADQPVGPAQPASPASLVPAARSAARSQPAQMRTVQVQLPDLESPSAGKGSSAGDGPIFQSMFRTERSGALSDTVRELWGGDASAPARRVVSTANSDDAGAPTELSNFRKDSAGNGGRRTGT